LIASTESWALFFHLLGVLLFAGGVVVAGVAFEAARRRSSPSEIALLLGLTRVGVLLVGLGTIVLLPFGFWLVSIEDVGFGTAWVVAAIALFVLLSVLGAIGGQRPKRARLLAEGLAAEGVGESEELRSALDDPVARTLNYVSASLGLAIVALMVFKPGG
jgi:uncharacterized membrane protein